MAKTMAGQRRTGPERHKEGGEPRPTGESGQEGGQSRIGYDTERSEPEGGAKRTAGNPADAGDRSEVTSERPNDGVVERGQDGDEE